MTKAIGIDIGGEIKFSSGEFQLSIPNVIGSSDPAGWGDLASDKSWSNNLILVEDEEEFYIGELARTQSQIKRFILDQGTLTKIDDIFLLVKAVLPLILREKEEDIALGIGLPISTPVEKMKELSSRLKGHFNVKVQNEATKESLEVVLHIEKVFVMPEAYGAYYNVVSDTEDETVIDAVVVSLDLLTELLVIYNGNLIRNASRNLTNASLFILANKIASALQQQVGAIVNPHSILKNIREDQNHVIISGKTYDIGKIKEHYIRQISSEIVDNLLEILKYLPMEATMEYYILSGEALDLFWTEIQMLILENELIDDFDVDKIIVVKNPAFANAIGFEKMVNKNIQKTSQKHDE